MTRIEGYDIDEEMVKIARENAKRAGVSKLVRFGIRPAGELTSDAEYGFVITNPPYGERLEEKAVLPEIYGGFGKAFKKMPTWSAYMITSWEDTEKYFGKKADKNRKIYNGMLKTTYYQFLGPKPPRK